MRFLGGQAGRQAGRYSLIAGLLAVALSAQVPLATLVPKAVAALGAGAQAGFEAHGTAEITGSDGRTAAALVTVDAWGASRCKISIDLLPAGRGHFEAVANGKAVHWEGPQLVAALPLPLGDDLGCALLPQGLLWADSSSAGMLPSATGGLLLYKVRPGQSKPLRPLTLQLDATTGLPLSAAWKWRGQAVTLAYSAYRAAGGPSFASMVTETAGAQRLAIHFASLAARADFSDSDFVVPPPPHPVALRRPGAGGGQ